MSLKYITFNHAFFNLLHSKTIQSSFFFFYFTFFLHDDVKKYGEQECKIDRKLLFGRNPSK